MQHVAEIIKDELQTYKKDPFFTYASVQFQPLPRVFTDHSIAQGGNVLGLDRYHDNNIGKSHTTTMQNNFVEKDHFMTNHEHAYSLPP